MIRISFTPSVFKKSIQTCVLALLFNATGCLTTSAQSIDLANAGFESGLENWSAFVPPYTQLTLSADSVEGSSS
ncbi:MAG: hypothetical protein AAGA30_11900, partial [Planctomycetota bacterium]